MILSHLLLQTLLSLALAFCCLLKGDLDVKQQPPKIVIVGGSLAGLGAAVTAANLSASNTLDLEIFLLEPTNWPGGQLTSSNVPVDFGLENSYPSNLPASLVSLLEKSIGDDTDWNDNPGKCWVSYKCFESQLAADYLRKTLLPSFPRLHVLYNTVVKRAYHDNDLRRITKVEAIRRTSTKGADGGYENLLSEDLDDWYSFSDSPNFKKEKIVFDIGEFDVVLEASEYGDVLSTAQLKRTQGIEIPSEDSDNSIRTCGQSTVFPFYMEISNTTVDNDDTPAGSDNGQPFSLGTLTWDKAWTYRRSFSAQPKNSSFASPGDTSNQNLNNDYASGYLFLDVNDPSEDWRGGINLTVLAGAEQRSFGYYHYMKNSARHEVSPYIHMPKRQTGTQHGLSKVPYLRESRRVSRGLDGFRLLYSHLNYSNPADMGKTAYPFEDVIGIGVYHYADIHALSSCSYPDYLIDEKHPVNPYYIPFRALTSDEVDNLLVPGKGMSQSFLANAATRLHPPEYASGVGAGAAAFTMIKNGWRTTREALLGIKLVQEIITGEHVNSPLTWSL